MGSGRSVPPYVPFSLPHTARAGPSRPAGSQSSGSSRAIRISSSIWRERHLALWWKICRYITTWRSVTSSTDSRPWRTSSRTANQGRKEIPGTISSILMIKETSLISSTGSSARPRLAR